MSMGVHAFGKLTLKPDDELFFDTKNAGEYLGLSYITIRLYINKGILKGHKYGGSWVLTKETLDAYQQTRRKVGYQRKVG